MSTYGLRVAIRMGLVASWFLFVGGVLWAAEAAPALPENWKQLPLEQYVGVMERMDLAAGFGSREGQSPAALAARSEMAAHAWSRYLGDPRAAGKLKALELVQLGAFSASHLTAEQKKQLAAELTGRFTADAQVWSGLSVEQFGMLLLLRLGPTTGVAANERAPWLVAYVAGSAQWRQADPAQLIELFWRVGDLRAEASASLPLIQARESLAQFVWNTYLADPQRMGALDARTAIGLAAVIVDTVNGEQKALMRKHLLAYLESHPQAWAGMTWREVGSYLRWVLARELGIGQETVALWTARWVSASEYWKQKKLVNIAELVNILAEHGQGSEVQNARAKFFVEVGREVIKRAEAGESLELGTWQLSSLARVLDADQARQLEKLMGGREVARLDVAMLLSWWHRRQGRQKEWEQQVAQRMADESLKGDPRAMWMLVRAYLAETEGQSGPLAGKSYLDQALATAQSEGTRLLCLQKLVRAYCALQQPSQAQSLLASLKPQFSEEPSIQKLQQLSDEIAKVAEGMQRNRVAQKNASAEAWLKEIRQRLEVARKAGDRMAVERYEKMIQTAQK